jgi:hypothetical protein
MDALAIAEARASWMHSQSQKQVHRGCDALAIAEGLGGWSFRSAEGAEVASRSLRVSGKEKKPDNSGLRGTVGMNPYDFTSLR